MPIKKYKNNLQFFSQQDSAVLNYFTFNKKAHFCSESKLFEAISLAVNSVSPYPTTHLTTYPYIAVHIRHGDNKLLKENEARFAQAVEEALMSCLIN
jgi:hypothetical protein